MRHLYKQGGCKVDCEGDFEKPYNKNNIIPAGNMALKQQYKTRWNRGKIMT